MKHSESLPVDISSAGAPECATAKSGLPESPHYRVGRVSRVSGVSRISRDSRIISVGLVGFLRVQPLTLWEGYKSVTRVLQECYNSVTRVLQ
jgi:hypothetical protein